MDKPAGFRAFIGSSSPQSKFQIVIWLVFHCRLMIIVVGHLGKFAVWVLNVSLLMSPCNGGDGDDIMMMVMM